MLSAESVERIVVQALAEDLGGGDITSRLVVPAGLDVEAEIISRAEGRIAGLPIADATFKAVDREISFRPVVVEGDEVKPGDLVAEIRGKAREVFAAERVALNFLQHLSGIATLTARYVAEVAGYRAKIYDTRKTLPGLRQVEKYAVVVGGGVNHRFTLFDGVLIKDNHLKAAAGVGAAVLAAKRGGAAGLVEVEVENLEELGQAIDAGAGIILLDNMSPAELARAVEITAGRAILEASGGVSLETVKEIAKTGVDRISVGVITQGAQPLDLSLEVVKTVGSRQ
ncbi:MAG: carboxylating nicotinate-nucleotide diphosphorylase [Actinobacteria bacterium]|nr:carboxylating nicotinate-nucleotide diphosphorylase [Actinomycetota bacterium]